MIDRDTPVPPDAAEFSSVSPDDRSTAPEEPSESATAGQVPKPAGTYAVGMGALEDKPLDTGPLLPDDRLNSITLDVSVELGRISLPFRRVRGMSQGEVIDLRRTVGDPLDVRVNGRLVARGEVVAIKGERYGIRLTEIECHDEDPGT